MPKEKDVEVTLFAGASIRQVTVSILEETYQEMMDIFRTQNWNEDEGLRIVMVHGLSTLKTQISDDNTSIDNSNLSEQIEKLRRELAEYQAMYAAMKFKAFQFMQESKILELNIAGWRNVDNLYQSAMEKLRAEKEALKNELQELRQKYNDTQNK